MLRLKKALCLFLSIVFLFQLLPVTALAADEEASYTNENAQPPTPSATGATTSTRRQASTTSRAATMTPPLADSLTRTIPLIWALMVQIIAIISLCIVATTL